jgi:hypothetical protein
MKISGPEHFKLNFDAKTCTANFSGLANTKQPKLYVIAVDGEIIYVGVTKSTMGARFYGGWKANGKNGYHGYAFRHTHKQADLYVWCHDDAVGRSSLVVETVEAEVAYLVRKAGQWPRGQTEIHFHRSEKEHRELAERIVQHIAGAVVQSHDTRQLCECGCGDYPKGRKSRFLPGHDLRKAYHETGASGRAKKNAVNN